MSLLKTEKKTMSEWHDAVEFKDTLMQIWKLPYMFVFI